VVEIHLCGKLRRYIKGTTGIQDNILNLAHEPEETIASLLVRMGIPVEEVYSILSTINCSLPALHRRNELDIRKVAKIRLTWT